MFLRDVTAGRTARALQSPAAAGAIAWRVGRRQRRTRPAAGLPLRATFWSSCIRLPACLAICYTQFALRRTRFIASERMIAPTFQETSLDGTRLRAEAW